MHNLQCSPSFKSTAGNTIITQVDSSISPHSRTPGLLHNIVSRHSHLELLHGVRGQVHSAPRGEPALGGSSLLVPCPVPHVAACQVLDEVPAGIQDT